MNVLYVEDSASDAEITRIELRRHDARTTVDVAATLAEARRRLANGNAYDLALVDLRLPDGDGLELIHEIRRQELPLAVVVLTGDGDEEIAVAALKAGANDYLAKRHDYAGRLPATLASALHRFRAEAARRSGTLHVLYAEHHAADLALTQRHLREHTPHIRLDIVDSGDQALRRLRDAPAAAPACDVLLLDYRLPGLTALDLLKVVRGELGLDLPVVLVTGQGDEEVAAQALRLGATDYLVKNPGYLHALPAALENAHHRVLLAREQAALRDSEARLAAVIESAMDAIVSFDAERRVVLFNPAAERMFRCPHTAAIGSPLEAFVAEESRAAFRDAMNAAGRGDSPSAEDAAGAGGFRTIRARRRDGEEFPAEVSISRTRAGMPLSTVILRDVTERLRNLEELRESRQRLMSIYDTVGDVIFLVAVERDGGFRFESVNKRFAATTGLPAEAVVGKRVEDVIPAPSLPLVLGRYREAIRDKAVVRWEETTDYPAGTRCGEVTVAPIFDHAGRGTHLVGAVHDVTERKEAEERQAKVEEMLRQAQKMEGIGRLAGGVAHDFNNILGVILGYGELMRGQIPLGHPARARLEQMSKAAERAAGLTRQLLAFSRKQVLQPKLLDLGAVVQDLTPMLERVVGEDLEVKVTAAAELGAVHADPTQIEQVLMNLVVNARDAMPEGGCLTIETTNVSLDEEYAMSHPPARPGHFVMLAVSDTGVGMDAETQKRIFEPFFTTKPAGEGTGLGLSTVYGIVKQTGGYVWVYSEVGRGTTFKVYLPRVDEVVTAEPEVAATPIPRGDETILVVEDSESLREMIRELLEEQGYRVIVAAHGEDALALARDRGGAIDLLLTDVVMPRLGGGDLVKHVLPLRPTVGVLYMSGYTSAAVSRQKLIEEGCILLEKPFTGEQLIRAVRTALDAAKRA